MHHQYRENYARNIYSNYDQMAAYVECSRNQSKSDTLSTFPSSNRRNFADSGKVLTAYKMVITTVYVQTDNCFCNK